MSILSSHFIIETIGRVDQGDLFQTDQSERLLSYKSNFSQRKTIRTWSEYPLVSINNNFKISLMTSSEVNLSLFV
ncbi:MAG: hypothetical protein ACI9V8_000709 [Urechidicola sp.]|jgi:hypothetical protein